MAIMPEMTKFKSNMEETTLVIKKVVNVCEYTLLLNDVEDLNIECTCFAVNALTIVVNKLIEATRSILVENLGGNYEHSIIALWPSKLNDLINLSTKPETELALEDYRKMIVYDDKKVCISLAIDKKQGTISLIRTSFNTQE